MPLKSKPMKCIQCERTVVVRPHRFKTFRFCSRKCGWAWHNENDRKRKDCAACGKSFSVISCRDKTAKYCSKQCYYKSMQTKGSVSLECVVCGKTFLRPPSRAVYSNPVCDRKCRGLLMRSDKPGSASTARTWLLRRGIVLKCNRCGYDGHPEILVVHHKDRDRLNNEGSNLEILCPNCHALEHYSNGH